MKSEYHLETITKSQAATILDQYHYLKDHSKGFKSGYNYGLFRGAELVGVIIFTGFPVPELVKGMFDLPRTKQDGFFELSRLCLVPEVQQHEHNLASWFVSRAIKRLRSEVKVRAILSYADSAFHEGTVYRACNFGYYGLSDAKKDFWFLQSDGSYKKHSRGTVKNMPGEWRERTRKHRFVICYDKSLNMKWNKV